LDVDDGEEELLLGRVVPGCFGRHGGDVGCWVGDD
jgi:hypothetical protein